MDRRLALTTHTGILVADEDDGEWQVHATPTDDRAECVHLDPRRPGRLFVGRFDTGLVRSTDAGRSFEHVGDEHIGEAAVTALAGHPTEPDRVLAGTEPSRLFESTDGGDTWRRIKGLTDVPSANEWSFPPRPDTHHVRWIEIDPNDPDRWYVGIEAGALLVTPDAGETWHDRPEGSRRDNHTLATHPEAPGRVYAAAGDGYAESTDAGETWTTRHDGLDHRYVWGLAVDPGDPETVVVSAASGASNAHRTPGDAYLYRRSDGGRWATVDDTVPTGPGHRRVVLASGPRPGTFGAATDDGVYWSDSGGTNWHRLPIDPPEPIANSLPRALAVIESS